MKKLILAFLLVVSPLLADTTFIFKLGDPATLSVSVPTNVNTPLTYQWSKNGVAIVGATLSSIRIAALTSIDVGTYTCVVSNAYGSTTSDNGFLVQGLAPASVIISIQKL
jgi:hypothetical protein